MSSGSPGDGAQQPAAPRLDLVEVAAAEQRLQRQGGVAQPAEAVVPVAHAAEVLREARRRRRDDAAGDAVAEDAQDEQRAGDGVGVGPRVVAARRPRLAERMVCSMRASTSSGGGTGLWLREPRRREGQHLTGGDVELVDVVAVPRVGEALAAQHEHVGPRDGADDVVGAALPVVGAAASPTGRVAAVAEAHDPLVHHPHGALETLDAAQHVGAAVGDRHEVGHAHGAGGACGAPSRARTTPRRSAASTRRPRRPARAAIGRAPGCRAGRRSTRASRSGAGTASRWTPAG